MAFDQTELTVAEALLEGANGIKHTNKVIQDRWSLPHKHHLTSHLCGSRPIWALLAAMCTYWSHCFYYLGCFVFVFWWLVNIHTTPISPKVETLCKMSVTTQCNHLQTLLNKKGIEHRTKMRLNIHSLWIWCLQHISKELGQEHVYCCVTSPFFRKQHSVSVWYEMKLIIGVSKWNSAPFLLNIGHQLLNSQFGLYFVLHNTQHVFSGGGGQDWTTDAACCKTCRTWRGIVLLGWAGTSLKTVQTPPY